MLNITLSKKQKNLLNDIISPDVNEIYVLGSTQSGKTFDICLGCILYAQELYKYDPNTEYNGAIVGWTTDTLKGNIVDVIEKDLQDMGLIKKDSKGNGDYDLKWGNGEKYLKIYNMKFYFFSFNNVLSFNKILGKPLIYVWIDESARIYGASKSLQEPFNEFPGRQMSFAVHPYRKTIHSFNVEGSENHDYKKDYLDKKPNAKHYTFFPYDNPKLNTEEAIKEVIQMFPEGSLREQKVYNKWVVASGRVFNNINKIKSLDNYIIREIGIGIDYGNVNPTTFVPIALAYNKTSNRWELIRLEIYYHVPSENGDTPTTEYYSGQLRMFLNYLHNKYRNVDITTLILDSEATHFHNRLITDNIRHDLAKKGAGSVDNGVQYLQSLIYKDYFYILETPSIKHIQPNGDIMYSGKDEGVIEFESYQYDTAKSGMTGANCYRKENDHQIDAIRYLLEEWKATNRSPIV